MSKTRSTHLRCSIKKDFLKILQNSQEDSCARFFFNKVAGKARNFIKKETLAKVWFCEICEIFKNTFFTEHLWVSASVKSKLKA